VGHAVATLFNVDPKQQMDDDLARLKSTIETGHPPRDAEAESAEPVAASTAHNGDVEASDRPPTNGPRGRGARAVRKSAD
jgi:hypothetical protein